jgi:zinc protease
MNEVGNSIETLVEYGLPDDYYEKDNLVWVVMGDRSKIEAGVRELNLGEVKFLDADGQPI